MTRLNSSKNKYNNVRCEYEGVTFDSKLERKRYIELQLMKQAKLIKWFNLQPSFLLTGGIRYRPDFIVCGIDNTIWVEDSKGVENATFIMKRKMWAELYPTIELRVVK